jgi:Cupredoxin-like domain
MELAMRFLLAVAAITALAWGCAAAAADMPEFALVIKDHVYQPSELKVPADTKFRLRVTNEDGTPEEFESTDFNRETVILAKHSILVYVGPLHAGTYGFFGDFHRDTAQGRLIVE